MNTANDQEKHIDSNDLQFLSAYSQIQMLNKTSQISPEHFQYLVSDLMKKYTQFLIHQNDEIPRMRVIANDIYLNNGYVRVLEC